MPHFIDYSDTKISRSKKNYVPSPRYKRRVPRYIPRPIHEIKEIAVVSNNQNAAGGYTAILNSIAEGTDFNQRVGRHVNPVGCYVDYTIIPPDIANDAQDWGQVALVWDKQPNDSLAGFSQIFDTTSASPGNAFKDTQAFRERFVILWREDFYIQASPLLQGTPNFQSPVKCRKYFKFNPRYHKIQFPSSSSAVPNTGALILCFGSFINSGTTTASLISYNTKFTYTDL